MPLKNLPPILCVVLAASVSTVRAAPFAEVAARDATLRDLDFVDAGHGFAVGDRGVVLRTDDGGRSWTQLETPVDCPLYGVSFIDRQNGWAVGGVGKPFTGATRGVVLRTRDGGASWSHVPTETTPMLRGVRFFDTKNGVAVGAGEAFHPSGVFVTGDGGRSWQPLPGDQPHHWRAADFFSPQFGIAVSARGALGMIAKGEVKPTGATTGDRRGYHAVRVAGPTTGWLVGDGGVVMKTKDAGRSWRPPPGALPAQVAEHFNWRSVATRGDQVWIAGSPGSVVLYSRDSGQSWQVQPTGVSLPLHSITFADARHGWAAGALGTILTTDDGGQTWRGQRSGGQRMAMDLLLADPRDAPVEMLAKLGAAEGYIASTGVVFGGEGEYAFASDAVRVAESSISAGGTHAAVDWRLPLSSSDRRLPADQLLAELNRKTDDRAAEELQRTLVARLRTLRPSAVVLVEPAMSASPGAAELLVRAIEPAVRAAADPSISSGNPAPWRVERVVLLTADGLKSAGGFSTGDFEPQLGTSVAQWASGARRLVGETYTAPPIRVGWRTLVGAATAGTRRGDLLAGVALSRGGEARRPAATPPAGNLDQLRSLAQKRRNMQQLLARKRGDDAWAGQVINLTGGLDPDSGAELLYQMATDYRDAGKLDFAADTFFLLAQRYTDHPLADSCLVWLLRYYASSEMAVHAAATARSIREPRPLANVAAGVGRRGANPAADLNAVAPSSNSPGVLTDDDRFERATRLAKYLRDARPALYADPAIRFPVVAAKRRLGYEKDAQRILLLLGKQAIDPAWRRCADAERWLAKPTELPPDKPVAVCKSIADRPHLDGKLTDACWTGAERIVLRDTEEGSDDAGVLRFLRDEQFLYLAVDCPMLNDVAYEEPATRRSRDDTLDDKDHLVLRFDTDRDYTAAFELAVDSQGRVRDRIVGGPAWRDRGWNPTWYVAANHEGNRWVIEAAVPIHELASPAPTPRDVWAIGVVRHTPGEPDAAWTDANTESPDHYGLLLMK